MNKKYIYMLALLSGATMMVNAQQDSAAQDAFLSQTIDVGADKILTLEESTAAVSVITSEDTDRRSAKNIGNSILGKTLKA